MSDIDILQYPDAINAPEIQVWNNAAFDNDDSDGRWSSCLDPDPAFAKENLSPGVVSLSVPVSSSVPAKPLRSNTAILNSQPAAKLKEEELEEVEQERIDSEIEAIEREIGRLSSRLEALRIEKAERKSKATERRGRIVPAKFLDPTPKKETPRSFGRRGLSLGPSEILAGAGFRRLSKLEVTPVQSAQNRRKSCFWKLEEIDELRATKERGKSQSLSPKSRKTASKTQPLKQSVTTSRKSAAAVKKEEPSIASTIQPKKLFGGEKSAAKKATRPGRVVASRYNSSAVRTSNEARKRSLPEEEEEEEEVKRSEKKRMSLAAGKSGCGGGGRGKKKWEIPTEVVVFREEEEVVLPKIRTLRRVAGESPARDSGPAKRVAELVGRRSYFSTDEEEESVCQVLSFGGEDEILK